MSTLFQWTLEEYEALGEVGGRVFADWRHPRHIELIRGHLKEFGQPAKLSVEEYLNMVNEGIFSRRGKKRLELIHGEILQMSPIGNPHEVLLSNLDDWSHQVAGRNFVIRVQCSIRLPTSQSVPEPDLVWAVRGNYLREKPGPEHILLLIEVADSSLAYDTGDKAEIYAAADIRDYWVVNIPKSVIEVRRDPSPSGYKSVETFSGRQEVRPLAFPDVFLMPDAIWE